jgi:hypothetical protein
VKAVPAKASGHTPAQKNKEVNKNETEKTERTPPDSTESILSHVSAAGLNLLIPLVIFQNPSGVFAFTPPHSQ